jgi:hypothetical protein
LQSFMLMVDGLMLNALERLAMLMAAQPNTQPSCSMADLFPDVPELDQRTYDEARERKYGVTLMNQLKRFDELSRSAEEAGQFSAAINAEKIRSSLGGLTIDRRESTHVHQLDNMSREDIVARLSSYPQSNIRTLSQSQK